MKIRLIIISFSLLFLISVLSGCVQPGELPETNTPSVTTTLTPHTTTSPTTQPAKKETSIVTLTVTDVNGNPLNGIVGFEKGFVHKNRYLLGAMISNGRAVIELPKVRDIPEVEWNYWGMHVYATDHVYFPIEIEAIPGENYELETALAPEPNPDDDPSINSIEFEKSDNGVRIKVDITSPINHLGPQDLAFNSKTGEMLVLDPPFPVASLRDDFPNGLYTIEYSNKDTDPTDWYFIVADEACSNGPLQGYPLNENILPAVAEGTTPVETQSPQGTPVELGAQLVSTQACINCHFVDKESLFDDREARINWRIGPGWKNLFKNEILPASGRPSAEENVIKQIREGGGGMPSYPEKVLTDDEVSYILAYLKTL